MDRLTSLEVFVSVVEQGGLSAAANARDLSPTMVAKHVRDIEGRLGVRLFNRTTRRQSLTEAGRTYYAHCKEVLERVDHANASIAALQTEPQGLLRLFAPVTFGAHRLAPLLSTYMRRYPRVKVDLTLSDRQMDLVEEGFDAALWVGRIEDSRYVVRELVPYAMSMGATAGYLALHGTPKHPNDLSGHNCLTYSYWDRQDTWRLVGPDGEFYVPVTGNFRVNNGPALLHAALAGLGIVLQAEVLLADSFASGHLLRVLPDYAPPSRPKSLLYLPDRMMTPKLRSFIDFALDNLGVHAHS